MLETFAPIKLKKVIEKRAAFPAWKLLTNVSRWVLHRERLQNPVRFSYTSMQEGESHSGGPQAGSGNEMRSRYSLEEGGHRGGPSSPMRVRILQPVLHSSQEGWIVGSLLPVLDLYQLKRSVRILKFKLLKQSCMRSGPRTGLSRLI